MDFMIISAVIFIISLTIIELSLYSFRNLRATQRAQLKKRLRKYTYTETASGNIIKNRKLSEIETLNKILLSSKTIRNLDLLVLQANAKYPLSVFVLTALFLGAFSGMILLIVTDNMLWAFLVGGLPCFCPTCTWYFGKTGGRKNSRDSSTRPWT